MSSLADELLADLDSGDEEVEEENTQLQQKQSEEVVKSNKTDGDDEVMDDAASNSDDKNGQMEYQNSNNFGIASLSTLMEKLNPILVRIDEDLKSSLHQKDIQGNIMHHPTYKLLVEANDYSVDIDNEIIAVHNYIKELYKKRFAELEQLVPSPVDYANTVKSIGNDLTKINENVKSFLPGATFMIITMSAYENQGQQLSPYELDQVIQACDVLLSLDNGKQRITSFVSTRLSVFAPNVTHIVSSHTAAQLMGFAGGLNGLSKIPNSNVPALGAKRQVGTGFGQTTTRQQGFLYHSELIQSVPADLRRKAMKMVAGKLVLAARVDLSHSSPDGSQGLAWRKEINDKLEKMVEPPENKPTKALPIPEDKKSKKRGGKRIRKFKEQFQMTELQKAQNRMTFGREDEGQAGYGEESRGGPGMPTGNVRNIQLDNKTKAKMSKGMQQRVQSVKRMDETTSGLQSSLAFTPVQGIELVAQQNGKPAAPAGGDNNWFKTGTFTSIAPVNKQQQGEVSLGPLPDQSNNKRKLNLPGPEPKKRSKDEEGKPK